MIDPWKIIVELESDNSRLFKEGVIEKYLNDKTFQEGLVMCLDPLTTFGVIEYTGCEAASLPTDINKLKEELMSNSLINTCSDANLPYFGIPLSVYNFLFSITFLILIIFNAYKKEK